MAQVTTTNPADFAFRRTVYLSREMLKTAMFSLRMYQFAEKKTFPGKGSTSIRFFRARKARKATGGQGPAQLTEGVQNLRRSEVAVGHLDCFLSQRGDDFEITDVVDATDVLDTLKVYMKTIGQDAALDFDSILTACVMGDATTANKAAALGLGGIQTTLFNSNATYGIATANYFERFAGVVNSGVSSNDFATLAGLSRANAKFTRLEHLRAITQLRANDVLPPDGKVYPVLVPPQVKFDIRQDTTLVSAFTQRDNKELYKWEEFELDGGAFIEQTNPWQEKNVYGTQDATGGIFTSLYLADDPFGCVRIDSNKAGGDPASPKVIVLDTPDKSDRYNQIVAGAWKSYFGAILKLTTDSTDVPRVCALRTQSSFQ